MILRKRFSVLVTAAFALSILAWGCAKEKAPTQPVPANMETARKENKTSPKVGVKWFSGTIEALDAAKGTLTLKGPKGVMDFKADGGAKEDLDDMKIGDKVIVKHSGESALSIVKPGANKNARIGKEKESPVKGMGIAPPAE
jgi:hypothetical protein